MVSASMSCKLEENFIENHRVLHLENQTIKVSIDVDRGAHIFAFIDKQTGINILYEDPKGFAEHDVGGLYELFPNAGKVCIFNGINIPNHGDVRNLIWSYQIDYANEDEVQLHLETSSLSLPFKLEKKLRIQRDKSSLFITELLTNIGNETLPFLWGHHVTFGTPFVNEYCRIDLPACRIYKRSDYGNDASRFIVEASGTLDAMPGKNGEILDISYFPAEQSSEMLFIDGLKEHWYNLFNEKLKLGCTLAWSGTTYPYLWLWQENYAAQQAPFHGKTRGMALEPQSSNVPSLTNAFNESEAPLLQAGQHLTSFMTLTMHKQADQVDKVDEAGSITYSQQAEME